MFGIARTKPLASCVCSTRELLQVKAVSPTARGLQVVEEDENKIAICGFGVS